MVEEGGQGILVLRDLLGLLEQVLLGPLGPLELLGLQAKQVLLDLQVLQELVLELEQQVLLALLDGQE